MLSFLVCYPGRFQIFHKGHKKVFDLLVKNFGNDDVFITTSNKVEFPKSPFDFDDKLIMITATGIDESKVIKTVQPYKANELTKYFDPEKTALVFAVSEKDMQDDPRFKFSDKKDGSPSYFRPYVSKEKCQPLNKHAYILEVPTYTFNVNGKKVRSSSAIRQLYKSSDLQNRKEIIKDLYGTFNKEVFNLLNEKLKNGELTEMDSSKRLRSMPQYKNMKEVNEWFDLVKDTYPQYADDMVIVYRHDGRELSAEVPKLDRCFGVFDLATKKYQTLPESVSARKRISKLLKESFVCSKAGNKTGLSKAVKQLSVLSESVSDRTRQIIVKHLDKIFEDFNPTLTKKQASRVSQIYKTNKTLAEKFSECFSAINKEMDKEFGCDYDSLVVEWNNVAKRFYKNGSFIESAPLSLIALKDKLVKARTYIKEKCNDLGISPSEVMDTPLYGFAGLVESTNSSPTEIPFGKKVKNLHLVNTTLKEIGSLLSYAETATPHEQNKTISRIRQKYMTISKEMKNANITESNSVDDKINFIDMGKTIRRLESENLKYLDELRVINIEINKLVRKRDLADDSEQYVLEQQIKEKSIEVKELFDKVKKNNLEYGKIIKKLSVPITEDADGGTCSSSIAIGAVDNLFSEPQKRQSSKNAKKRKYMNQLHENKSEKDRLMADINAGLKHALSMIKSKTVSASQKNYYKNVVDWHERALEMLHNGEDFAKVHTMATTGRIGRDKNHTTRYGD